MKSIKINKISIKSYCGLMAISAYILGVCNVVVSFVMDLLDLIINTASNVSVLEVVLSHVVAIIYIPLGFAIGGFFAGMFSYPLFKYILNKKGPFKLEGIDLEIDESDVNTI